MFPLISRNLHFPATVRPLGAIYGHHISKESTVKFWRKALCRAVDLHFDKEIQMYGILGYRYILGPDVYDRKSDNETDCYKGTYSVLPNGLTDASKCYFGKCL